MHTLIDNPKPPKSCTQYKHPYHAFWWRALVLCRDRFADGDAEARGGERSCAGSLLLSLLHFRYLKVKQSVRSSVFWLRPAFQVPCVRSVRPAACEQGAAMERLQCLRVWTLHRV